MASELSWLERRAGFSSSRAQTPLKSYSQLRRSQPSLICDLYITHFEQSARIVKQFTASFGRFYSTTHLSVAPHNKSCFLQIIRQPGCANLIDSHVSLQSLNGCNWNTVAWVVELTSLHAIVKCESLLASHGKVCFIVSQSKMFLILILCLRWPRATLCVNSCMFHGIEHVMCAF